MNVQLGEGSDTYILAFAYLRTRKRERDVTRQVETYNRVLESLELDRVNETGVFVSEGL